MSCIIVIIINCICIINNVLSSDAVCTLSHVGSEKTLDYKSLCELAVKRVVQAEQGKGQKPTSAMSAQKGKKKTTFAAPKSA